MKRFKNKFAVEGKQSLLKAFEEELKELGYVYTGAYHKDDYKMITVDGVLGYGRYITSAIYEAYQLPGDWDKVLELAAETEYETKYKVGDFVAASPDDLGYVSKIEDGKYHLIWECNRNSEPLLLNSFTFEYFDNNEFYNKVSDEVALETLKRNYALKGIVEGAEFTYGMLSSKAKIVRFYLRKDLLKRGITEGGYQWLLSAHSLGDSQLVIDIDEGKSYRYITPSVPDFRILDDVMVREYSADILEDIQYKLLSVGCHRFTLDSLKVIRALLSTKVTSNSEVISFSYEDLGDFEVSLDLINKLIRKFN